ncbi:MAG: amidohydrolase [Salinibacter sp.]
MPGPDYVVHNANIYTIDGRHPTATAFGVRDGRFRMVGTDASVGNAAFEVHHVDAEGHTIVPGFVDAHAHLHELGHALRRADLSAAGSPRAVVERLTAFAAEHDLPPGAWLRGHGWDETRWPAAPSRAPLDAAFPERPVWVVRTDIHAGWANTAALEATVGLDRLRRMDDPAGGRIDRDDAGRPTGVLVDEAMALVEDSMPPPTDAEQDRALRTALRHAARRGVTSVHDAGVERSEIRRFRRFIEADSFPCRVYAMALGESDAFDHACEHGPLRHPSGRLDVASVKFFADGALGSRGAALLDDYADAPGNVGLLRHSPEALRARVRRAVECGLQVNTHAIGDRAVRGVLDAYEAAAAEADAPVRRPRIEHAQVVAPEDRPRFGALGAVASVQPAHATSDLDWVAARLGTDRLDRAYAWASLRDAGARLAFGSDAPVEPLDPIRALHAAITRQTPDGRPEGGWRPAERIARAAALRAHTLGAAYAGFQEDEIGSIAPGKRADWVVLSRDPMRVPPEDLPGTEVLATYLDGHRAYATADWPDL